MKKPKSTYPLVFSSVIVFTLFLAIFVHAVTEVRGYYFGQRSLFITISISMLVFFLFVLIARYLILLWFSFMQQLEYLRQREDTGYRPLVTVIVPAYNEERVLQPALESLLRQDYPYFEVIVIDDGSLDQTYLVAQEFVGDYGKASIRALRQPNRGKAAALNMGISVAKGELVLCMDADSNLVPGAISAMVQHFSDRTVAAVAGNRWKTQINENGKAMAFWSALPELDHNEIVGWTSWPGLGRERVGVVFLHDSGDHSRIALRAINIMGGYGTVPQYEVVRRLNDSIELFTAAGTQEVIKNTLARSIIS